MAQQPAGERRNEAMEQAREALMGAQEAMMQLPVGLRRTDVYREAQQRAGEAQAALHAREANQASQQQAQQAADQLHVAILRFDAAPVADPRYATRLLDKNLVGANGKDAGHVEDLVLDRNWRVRGAVVEWGGFLGLGERRAIIPIDRIGMTNSADGRAQLNMTREELERLPVFEKQRAG
ncbi:PRC-barrel domain-containing protein [Roseomonas sp. SSH11]|uniref:PRC-barrel domain-containing protein n=2 Tax=Pararoseomonas baculiformis TaxID=2820812 RepID=A0ABS4AEV3_9PROT|nr:PRC-barrel domain-containing protein [Pararoseomonas baculiformis]